ncbi:hypothetical protein M422DRAFT_243539 [Sphaerobolus stellatus SS14]|nr:hypothetical protein M422DRAFT_243539 [Sphaerobolus stellatus SS14]
MSAVGTKSIDVSCRVPNASYRPTALHRYPMPFQMPLQASQASRPAHPLSACGIASYTSVDDAAPTTAVIAASSASTIVVPTTTVIASSAPVTTVVPTTIVTASSAPASTVVPNYNDYRLLRAGLRRRRARRHAYRRHRLFRPGLRQRQQQPRHRRVQQHAVTHNGHRRQVNLRCSAVLPTHRWRVCCDGLWERGVRNVLGGDVWEYDFLAINVAVASFNVAQATLDELSGGKAIQLGRVNVTAVLVAASGCGL